MSNEVKRSLPQTEAELYEFTTHVLHGTVAPDNAEYRGIVAEMILHLDNRINEISISELTLMLKRRIANAVAYGHLMLAKEIAAKETADARQKAKEVQELSKVLDGPETGEYTKEEQNVLSIAGSGPAGEVGPEAG